MDFAFDATWDRAFKGSPFRLRFELGGEQFDCVDAPVPRFVQALTRSRRIRDAVFADAPRLWAVVASETNAPKQPWASTSAGFEALAKLGFRAEPVAEWRAQWASEEPEQTEQASFWRAFDVTSDIASQDALLWCNIASEMPIHPRARVHSYLADFERGFLLHVYDDRGMDVSAAAAALLLPFYEKFDSWLHDYDRERMKVAFVGT